MTTSRRRSWSTTSSTPMHYYIGSPLQLFFRCSARLVLTMIYDPFTCKFPGCNGRYSASVAYLLPYNQDFIPGAEPRFWLSRDFADGCLVWDPWGHTYDVSVRFFPYMMYIDSNRRDTLGYEWTLVRCCHLIVCLIVLMAWIRGCCLWLSYHDDCYITLFMTSTILLMFCLLYACCSL
jgi:hypothetical protein